MKSEHVGGNSDEQWKSQISWESPPLGEDRATVLHHTAYSQVRFTLITGCRRVSTLKIVFPVNNMVPETFSFYNCFLKLSQVMARKTDALGVAG